jgi:DNA-binding NtrC family response regulator
VSKETSILIVDDEEPIRRLLTTCLDPNYTCITAASAEEATTLLEAGTFSLVLRPRVVPTRPPNVA